MTDEQKKKLQEELAKLTSADLIDLNIGLKEKLEKEEEASKKERSKIMTAFLHTTTTPPKAEKEKAKDGEEEDKYFKTLCEKIALR